MNSFCRYLVKLYRENKKITLLNLFYISVAILMVFVAGICALINQAFGVAMLIIPVVAVAALCANVMVWALLKTAIEAIEDHAQDHADKNSAPKPVPKTDKKLIANTKADKPEQDKKPTKS